MALKLDRHGSEGMAKGINTNPPELTATVILHPDSVNLTSGIQQGIGPRYGFSTIPGQHHNTAPAGGRCNSAVRSEAAATDADGVYARRKFYRVYPVQTVDLDTRQKKISYLWLVTLEYLGSQYVTAAFCSAKPGATFKRSSDFSDGIGIGVLTPWFTTGSTPFDDTVMHDLIPGSDRAPKVYEALSFSGNYLSSAVIAVSGQDIPMRKCLVYPTGVSVGSVPPKGSFWTPVTFTTAIIATPTIDLNIGIPSSVSLRSVAKKSGGAKVTCLGASALVRETFSTVYDDPTTIYPGTIYELVNDDFDASVPAATNTRDSGVSGGNAAIIVEDNLLVTNSQHTAILVCGDKPLALIHQPWVNTNVGHDVQAVNLSNHQVALKDTDTEYYSEDGAKKNTAFKFWPSFSSAGSFPTGGAPVLLGPTGTGVLRKDSTYEFTYSIFYKRLGIESNVGTPVKLRTDSFDFRSLYLSDITAAAAQTLFYRFFTHYGIPAPVDPNIMSQGHLNYIEYRFYYRLHGTYQWLPALFIDAVKFWFATDRSEVQCCTGGIAGLPGGQPGGFVDYSQLPAEKYVNVTVFKNRAFWCSAKSINFSLEKNIFAYPARNSISIPTGELRGTIAHAYPGQAEQSSRLVIFASDQVYVARFTGDRQLEEIQLSPDTSATFPIDGSDLIVDSWTSITAFSHRSAVVADGILCYWGPQGVYADVGNELPEKISGPLEPDIFNYYDPDKTDEICCTYNEQTKEIIWLYRPKDADGYETHGLVYNTQHETWLRTKYDATIDDVFNLNIEGPYGTYGKRTIASIRGEGGVPSSIQRPYFYDQNNRSGDIKPGTELLVTTISTPSGGVRRLTCQANTSMAGIINVDDYLTIEQVKRYTGTAASDIIGKIIAIGGTATAPQFDIALPAGATLADATLGVTNYFPIWHLAANGLGRNGFPWVMKTHYWAPAGINYWAYWLYLYFMSKVSVYKGDLPLTWGISYRTPISNAYRTDTVALADNSDGSSQLYHPLAPGDQNFEGQALKLLLSGNHIGHQWVLQYLEAHAQMVPGDQLKIFEG